MMEPRHSGPARLVERTRRAVTLTELLVVMVIITLLSTLIVPVAVNKAQQARVATAKAELREIAHAMETCGAIHGFYVPIHILDDLPNDTVAGSTDRDDLENSEAGDAVFLIDPVTLVEDQDGSQLELSDYNSDSRVAKMWNEWAGPFFSPKRVFIDTTTANRADILRRDYPLDPWGQPYRFYSSIGLIGQGAHNEDPDDWDANDNIFDGRIETDDDRYDRYAIVSFGPDSEEETDIDAIRDGTTDDIIYEFGGAFNANSFKAFY